MKDPKGQQIKSNLEKVIDQVQDTGDKLYANLQKINFKETLADSSLEILKYHLGYTKNYSDLTKTRLLYQRYLGKVKPSK